MIPVRYSPKIWIFHIFLSHVITPVGTLPLIFCFVLISKLFSYVGTVRLVSESQKTVGVPVFRRKGWLGNKTEDFWFDLYFAFGFFTAPPPMHSFICFYMLYCIINHYKFTSIKLWKWGLNWAVVERMWYYGESGAFEEEWMNLIVLCEWVGDCGLGDCPLWKRDVTTPSLLLLKFL